MANKIQLRRDNTSDWSAANPLLSQGEIGINLTLNQIKIGDGISSWESLPYMSVSGVTNLSSLTDVALASLASYDILIYNGSTWVNTQLTVVASSASVVHLASLDDVTITSPTSSNVLIYDGSTWMNTPFTSINNVDGGFANSTYLTVQLVNGGDCNG